MKKLVCNAISCIQLDTVTKKIQFILRDGNDVWVVNGATVRAMTKAEKDNKDDQPDK